MTAVSNFGDLLLRLRKAAALSREDLAERSGVSARAIADLELGKTRRPHRDTVSLLADGLQLTDADLAKFKRPRGGARPRRARQGRPCRAARWG